MKYHAISKQLFETNVDSSTYCLLNLSNSNLTTTLDISINKEKLTQIDKEIEKDPSYKIFTFIKSKYEALDFAPIFENLNDTNLANSEICQEKDESQCTEIINDFNFNETNNVNNLKKNNNLIQSNDIFNSDDSFYKEELLSSGFISFKED